MKKKRVRDYGICPGIYDPGPNNSITDVSGVAFGHYTLIQGDDVRTGATAVLPHDGNLYQERVPAGLAVGNGFGKLMGVTQLQELGELETPILLTNTLAVPRAAEAIIEWTLVQEGNEAVCSVNPVVGETNDGRLNNSRRQALTKAHFLQAIETAAAGKAAARKAVAEGSVGAGTGTVCFGWKGGIGSSSRRLPQDSGSYTLGVLVQTNYGGFLQISGVPVGEMPPHAKADSDEHDGSIMIVVATDAPLSDRNLARLAWRTFAGVARTGSSFSNASGDYAIAFSTDQAVRRTASRRRRASMIKDMPNALLPPLFQAAIEATEEAIYNALFMATTVTGYKGLVVEALPVEDVVSLVVG
jgi:D-aminopeptidase